MYYKDITEASLNTMSINCILSLFKRAKDNVISIHGNKDVTLKTDDTYIWIGIHDLNDDFTGGTTTRYAIRHYDDHEKYLFEYEVDTVYTNRKRG